MTEPSQPVEFWAVRVVDDHTIDIETVYSREVSSESPEWEIVELCEEVNRLRIALAESREAYRRIFAREWNIPEERWLK